MANFTFISQQNPDGRSRRAAGRRACESCRARKRRCTHRNDVSTRSSHQKHLANGQHHLHDEDVVATATTRTAESSNVHQQQQWSAGESGVLSPAHDLPDDDDQDTESETNQQFVGDLNPAARLLDEAEVPAEQHAKSPSGVGVWIRSRLDSNTSPTANSTSVASTAQNRQPRQYRSSVSDIIATEHVLALSHLYFSNIHPMLPLLNEEEFQDLLGRNKIPMPLVHAVCLVAAKDKAASPHLRLLELPGSAIPIKIFCSKLHASITTAIQCESSIKRINLIRVLCLLSLHQEGRNGGEQASGHIAMACHHAQSLAIHLHQPDGKDNFEMKKIFWCVWTLDKLNAVINSRPCILHDDDIAIEQPKPGESSSAAFDIWFQISKILNRAIALYRPTNPDDVTGIELEYTGFEQLVEEMQGWHLSSATLATLRIFFLATAILAYRLKTIRILPATTSARLRQQLSAIQIIRQLRDGDHLESLHPLPIIVYGASLASSVSYQQLRYSKLALDQEEALRDFRTSCDILQNLQQKWSSADAMASLTRKVSIELEKVPNLALVYVNNGQLQRSRADLSNNDHGDATHLVPQESGQEYERLEQTLNDLRTEDPPFAWDPQAYDIFGGMDDMSWMYLDAENPIRPNNPSYLEMWG